MITAREEDSQKLMMDAAVKLVANEGFEGFTTKKWAAQAGVAEGSLYYHFKSKDDLLEKTFTMIDKGIAGCFTSFAQNMKKPLDNYRLMRELWYANYGHLIDNPEATLYYYRFRTSTRYTQEVQAGQIVYFQDFISIVREFNEETGLITHLTENMIWVYLIDTTLAFAFRVITKGLEDTEENRKQMFTLFAKGVIGMAEITEAEEDRN